VLAQPDALVGSGEQPRQQRAALAIHQALATEKQGRLKKVVHPNPTQQQQFPATKATRGKRK
jgi:hypothetical protein